MRSNAIKCDKRWSNVIKCGQIVPKSWYAINIQWQPMFSISLSRNIDNAYFACVSCKHRLRTLHYFVFGPCMHEATKECIRTHFQIPRIPYNAHIPHTCIHRIVLYLLPHSLPLYLRWGASCLKQLRESFVEFLFWYSLLLLSSLHALDQNSDFSFWGSEVPLIRCSLERTAPKLCPPAKGMIHLKYGWDVSKGINLDAKSDSFISVTKAKFYFHVYKKLVFRGVVTNKGGELTFHPSYLRVTCLKTRVNHFRAHWLF